MLKFGHDKEVMKMGFFCRVRRAVVSKIGKASWLLEQTKSIHDLESFPNACMCKWFLEKLTWTDPMKLAKLQEDWWAKEARDRIEMGYFHNEVLEYRAITLRHPELSRLSSMVVAGAVS